MSKAEERGKIYAIHKASEKLHDYYGLAMLSVVQFDGNDIKNAYKDGHQQAEKDLALTWQDIKVIEKLLGFDNIIESPKEYYQEVLNRFNEERKEK